MATTPMGSGRRGIFVLALAGCVMLATGVPARASAAARSAGAAARPSSGAGIHLPPPLLKVRLPRVRIEVPERPPPALRPRRSLPVRPDVVPTPRFGRVTPEIAERLESDEVYLHRMEDNTGARLFPDSRFDSDRQREVKRLIRIRVRACVSSGLVSVGKSAAFNQLLSRDKSLYDLFTPAANRCLNRLLPGLRGRVAGALAEHGLNDAGPAIQQAWEHSPQDQVFRNWLAGLSY